MDVLTRSSNGRPGRNGRAWAAVVAGLAGVAAVPAAVAAAEIWNAFDILAASAAIPVAAAGGIAAILLARRAREQMQRTLGRVGGRRIAGLGRVLGYLGLWLATTAALAVGVYALLSYLAD